MLATVILSSGPNNLQIDPISGSLDGLAVIRKWQDDPYSDNIVAQIPGTDAWTTVCSQEQLSHPEFPLGHVAEALQKHVDELPGLIEEFVAGKANPKPIALALARYLGIYTEAQVTAMVARREAERQARDEEWNRRKQEEQAKVHKEARLVDESYHGFLRGMSPLKAGKVRAVLEKQLQSDGVILTRKELIEKLVKEGRKLEDHPVGGRILIDRRTNRLFLQKDLSKTAFDYAAFLGA